MNKVTVKDIRCFSYHGCLDEEAIIGNDYLVDVEMTTDFKESAEQDDLSKTIDYVIVNQIVEQEMAKRSKLIETVGYRILRRLQNESFEFDKNAYRDKKINPPLNGDVGYVSVIIEE
jgi:FolB domain